MGGLPDALPTAGSPDAQVDQPVYPVGFFGPDDRAPPAECQTRTVPLGPRSSAVLLDALGTLVKLQPPAPRLVAELRRSLGLEVSLAQAERAIGAEISYYREHLEQGRDAASLNELRACCAEVLARELQVALGEPVPAGPAMVEVLVGSLSFSVFADVPEALAELCGLGVRLVVVSNWDVSLPDVLGRLGLTRWLDGVVTCAEVGERKPARAVFERGLAVAGVAAERALHVGDSLYEDVQGAIGAGIEPVLIRRGGADPSRPDGMLSPPDARDARDAGSDGVRTSIRSLRELPRLVCA